MESHYHHTQTLALYKAGMEMSAVQATYKDESLEL